MHLTAFSCIFLPLYTHLGQAHTIFAAQESCPSSPPSSYPYPACSFFRKSLHKIKKKEQAKHTSSLHYSKKQKNALFLQISLTY